MVFRITTWNVNGIRNPFGYQPWRDRRTFAAMFELLEADIVIMQELKIQRKDLTDDIVLVPGWDSYFSLPKHKKGYSGVGIYVKTASATVLKAEEGILGVLCPPGSSVKYRDHDIDDAIGGYLDQAQIDGLGVNAADLDAEGRCVVLEFPGFVLFGIYSPANSNGLRDDFRHAFMISLDTRVRNLTRMGKRVVVTGDLNVSRCELDTANADDTLRKENLTHEEYISTPNRRIFNQLIEHGDVIEPRDVGREKPVLVDLCRDFHPTRKGMFTHWEQKMNARPANFGSRIDFVLCSLSMRSWFEAADIQEGLMGSDHCPVYAILKDKFALDNREVDAGEALHARSMNSREQLGRSKLPTLCARLMPEFDRRQNIKSMFARSNSNTASLQEAVALTDDQKSIGTSSLAQTSKPTPVTSFETPSINGSSPGSQATVSQKKRLQSESPIAKPAKKPARAQIPSKKGTTASGGGQASLIGFFSKANKSVTPSPTKAASTRPSPGALSKSNVLERIESKETQNVGSGVQGDAISNGLEVLTYSNSPTAATGSKGHDTITSASTDEEEVFIDPFVAKASWDKLFTKPQVPRCESHDEPCISLLSKKKGFNFNRTFWICPRPLGPSGSKETGTAWRCRTFIWSSDWNGKGEG